MSSPITLISSANMVLKDCEPSDGWRPASVDGGVIMAAKKKHNGINFQLTATEATLKNARAMSGAWVSASKPLGECKSVGERMRSPASIDAAEQRRARRAPCSARLRLSVTAPLRPRGPTLHAWGCAEWRREARDSK